MQLQSPTSLMHFGGRKCNDVITIEELPIVEAAKTPSISSEYSVQFIHRTFIFDLRDRVINQIPGEPIMPSGGGLDKKKKRKCAAAAAAQMHWA